jgi:hypothetical protein
MRRTKLAECAHAMDFNWLELHTAPPHHLGRARGLVRGHLLCNFELTAVCEQRGTRNSQKALIKESRMLKKPANPIIPARFRTLMEIRAGAAPYCRRIRRLPYVQSEILDIPAYAIVVAHAMIPPVGMTVQQMREVAGEGVRRSKSYCFPTSADKRSEGYINLTFVTDASGLAVRGTGTSAASLAFGAVYV